MAQTVPIENSSIQMGTTKKGSIIEFEDSNPDYKRRDCPELKANFLSRLLYWWLNDIVNIGNKKVIEEHDLYTVRPDMKADILTQQFNKQWKIEVEKCKNK